MQVFFKVMSKILPVCAQFAKNFEYRKKNRIKGAIFFGRGLKKKIRVFFSREKIRKSEYFCEHLKVGEDFRFEYFKFLDTKKRVKQSSSRMKKRGEKKPMTGR